MRKVITKVPSKSPGRPNDTRVLSDERHRSLGSQNSQSSYEMKTLRYDKSGRKSKERFEKFSEATKEFSDV